MGKSIYPMSKIKTGQRFPRDTQTYQGQCQRCGRIGSIASVWVIQPQMRVNSVHLCCPECLADFAAAASGGFPGLLVGAEHVDGNMRRVGFNLTNRHVFFRQTVMWGV